MKKVLVVLLVLSVLGFGLYLFLDQTKPKEVSVPAPVVHEGVPVRKGMVFKAHKKRISSKIKTDRRKQ